MTFPLDLPNYLPAINRTESTIAEAEAKLTLPKDQMRYGQFWFLKHSPIDDIAFNHLLAGDMAKAEDIWSKKETFSSLQNSMICALIRKDYAWAIATAGALYGVPQYVMQLRDAIIGENDTLTVEELTFGFLDSLVEEVGASVVLPYIIFDSWRTHIIKKAVTPLIDNILSAIEIAKRSNGKGANVRLTAGEKLRDSTSSSLQQLKEYCTPSDLQYQMTVDKLGLEILQCGIDYYSDSDVPDAIYKAMSLQQYAQSIVIGATAKSRCKENVDNLQKIIDNLPPREVFAEYKAILSCLNTFIHQSDSIASSFKLMRDCAPHIISIKEKLGRTHPHYLKVSTIVVSKSLDNVVSAVNEAQEKDFATLKSTLMGAWRAQLLMDQFELESEFRFGRYKQNRQVLYDIINHYKGFTSRDFSFLYGQECGWCMNEHVEDLRLLTDDEVYSSCNDLASLESYIKKFPYGKHAEEAKSRIEILTFKDANTITAFERFIQEYPQSKLIPEAKAKIDDLNRAEERARKRKKRAEISKTIFTWFLVLFIPSAILFTIYLIWGIGGLSTTCYIIAIFCGMLAVGGIGAAFDKQQEMKLWEGCLISLISAAIAIGLWNLASFLDDVKKQNKEMAEAQTIVKKEASYSHGDSLAIVDPMDGDSAEFQQARAEYEKYIDNQLETGDQPYSTEYGTGWTGDNYLDFKTSGACDYIIIVRTVNNNKVINHVYIRGGESARLYLPDGSYNIYFYSGKGWNPDKQKGNVVGGFVSNESTQKDEDVSLYNRYGEYTLYPVQHGNLILDNAADSETF